MLWEPYRHRVWSLPSRAVGQTSLISPQGLGFGNQPANFQPRHMMGRGINAPFGTVNPGQPLVTAGGSMTPPYGSWPYTSGPGVWGPIPSQQPSPFDRLGLPQRSVSSAQILSSSSQAGSSRDTSVRTESRRGRCCISTP